MVSGPRKQLDTTRLTADLAAARVELLSAQCATDRVRLQYSTQDVATFADREALEQAIASAEALWCFFSQLRAQIRREGSGQTQQ